MTMLRRSLLPLLALLSCSVAHAAHEEIVFIAPMNHAMPLAQFKDGRLSGGILMDLGVAIAQRLGRTARFVSVPSKRVSMVLSKGEADGVCYVMPHWIDGDFNWSRPLIPNRMLVVAHARAPLVGTVAALSGQPIGTVAGYRYPEMEAALGKGFVRDDAPNGELSISKLRAGRTRYAIMGESMFDYQRRNDASFQARSELVVASVTTQCAFSRTSTIPFAQVEHAINAMIEKGSVREILSHYR
jgi:polar amino acid transport system substrate-binding protein